MRERFVLRLAVLMLAAAPLAGCGNTVAVLHNAKTGQTARCTTYFPWQTAPTIDSEVCVHQFEERGFTVVTPD